MFLLDVFKRTVLGQIIAVAVPCIFGTWVVTHSLYVTPRDFTIKLLEAEKNQLRYDLERCRAEVASSDHGANDSLRLAEEILEKAQEAIVNRSYSDALKKLDLALYLQPNCVKARIVKGRILLEYLNLYENALGEFMEAWRVDRRNNYLPYYIGLAYYRLMKFDEAITWSDTALALDPDLIIALHRKGVYYMESGDLNYGEAEECFRKVINRDREFASEARLYLLALYFRLGEREVQASEKPQYRKKAERLIGDVVAMGRRGDDKARERALVFLQRITGEIQSDYLEDLRPIRRDLESMRSDTALVRIVQTGIRHLAD